MILNSVDGCDVLYEDAFMLAVDKPSGLLSVPGRGPDKTDCIIARVLRVYPDALVVHRLDQPTSGVLLFARSLDVQRALSEMFASRLIAKRYEAIVEGALEGSGVIDLPLIADWPNRPLQKVDHHLGKPASTIWTAVGSTGQGTRVSLEPLTGRSHQLRVHMQAIGHPILGDQLYGSADGRTCVERLLLHAAELKFAHPVTGEAVEIRSTVPF